MHVPFYPISDFYKFRFGERVQKIPVSISTDCPNRRGLKGMETCIFCDEWGSSAYPELQAKELRDQIEAKIHDLGERYNAKAFLAYFQSYTSTFLGINKLRESFKTALEFPQIKGLVIGTRPDCLSQAVFELWNEFGSKTFMAVELGVQSFFDDQLVFLKRGHTAQCSLNAIRKIKAATTVDLGIHLIFGLPGETPEQILQTAEIVSELPVDNVKLHNLYVLKNTPLARVYEQGGFTPLSLEEYAKRVALFLQHLRPNIAVHRLAALSSRWDELIAPEWTKHKMRSHQFIVDFLNAKQISQGQKARAR